MGAVKHDSVDFSIEHFSVVGKDVFTQDVKNPRAKYLYFCLALGWGILIFYLSSQSSIGKFASPFAHFDKLVHVGIYGILTLLLYRAFINTPGSIWKRHPVILSILLSVLYGLTDEIHQMFVPMRTVELADFLADCGGTGLFFLFLFVSSLKFKREKTISKTQRG